MDAHSLYSTQGRRWQPPQHLAALLPDIGAQAAAADRSRTIAPELIRALKRNDVMRLSGSKELGGLNATVLDIGNELRGAAVACTSTAWCLWNHLCTFHHFTGLLGPPQLDFLGGIVSRQEWVCFPAGASTKVKASAEGDRTLLTGVAAFGSGARYADWAGVVFSGPKPGTLGFSMTDLHGPGVRIDATWEAMSLRASATDHLYYEQVAVPSERVVPWMPMYRA